MLSASRRRPMSPTIEARAAPSGPANVSPASRAQRSATSASASAAIAARWTSPVTLRDLAAQAISHWRRAWARRHRSPSGDASSSSAAIWRSASGRPKRARPSPRSTRRTIATSSSRASASRTSSPSSPATASASSSSAGPANAPSRTNSARGSSSSSPSDHSTVARSERWRSRRSAPESARMSGEARSRSRSWAGDNSGRRAAASSMREREPVEQGDDLAQRLAIPPARFDARAPPLGGPRDQLERGVLVEGVQRQHALGGQPQRRLGGHQQAQIGKRVEQRRQVGRGFRQVLEVVQHDERRPALAQARDHGLGRRDAHVPVRADRRGDGGHHGRRCLRGGEAHQPHPAGVLVQQRRGRH